MTVADPARGNPVPVAAAKAVLDVIRDEGLVANSSAMGHRLLTGLTIGAAEGRSLRR